MKITQRPFGHLGNRQVDLFTLRNGNGIQVEITNYGGIIVSLLAPDRHGQLADIVLGFDTLEQYIASNPYFGALVGRYANRIGGAAFIVDGIRYTLAKNNGPNHLHGGLTGFDRVIWQPQIVQGDEGEALQLTYHSRDGEEGYPGNLTAIVVYTLTADNALQIDYSAVTDAPTIVNLTNHTYFNLVGSGPILDHVVWIDADGFTPTNASLIPTGELRPVAGTPMDFRRPMPIGARIDEPYEPLQLADGYDHNWILNHAAGELALSASVYEPATGRQVEVFTTQPGVQFYSGNFLTTMSGKGGQTYHRRYGLCLETQHFPDSPNHAHFPPVILRPGERYTTSTRFKFSAEA